MAAEGGSAWCDAAAAAAREEGVPLDVLRVGVDFEDPRQKWQRRAGIAGDGALLVRPDGFVAWRAESAEGAAAALIRDALRMAAVPLRALRHVSTETGRAEHQGLGPRRRP